LEVGSLTIKWSRHKIPPLYWRDVDGYGVAFKHASAISPSALQSTGAACTSFGEQLDFQSCVNELGYSVSVVERRI
jgi:hypothetical protein